MCLGGAPSAKNEDKPVEYLHNKYLDGYTIAGAGVTKGRNDLRIDLGAPTSSGVNTATAPVAQPPVTTPRPMAGPTNPTLKLLPSPGMVVPTIGGSLAGTLPGVAVK